ncbi:MAG: hypothetical protein H6815_04300 [Phycisphaeraceae bacterium]|nr:hypothetical protein [Phycisphaerales bacterium]MCB9859653.1 hypothetical protein [Phycisphaeraceae bacterium]
MTSTYRRFWLGLLIWSVIALLTHRACGQSDAYANLFAFDRDVQAQAVQDIVADCDDCVPKLLKTWKETDRLDVKIHLADALEQVGASCTSSLLAFLEDDLRISQTSDVDLIARVLTSFGPDILPQIKEAVCSTDSFSTTLDVAFAVAQQWDIDHVGFARWAIENTTDNAKFDIWRGCIQNLPPEDFVPLFVELIDDGIYPGTDYFDWSFPEFSDRAKQLFPGLFAQYQSDIVRLVSEGSDTQRRVALAAYARNGMYNIEVDTMLRERTANKALPCDNRVFLLWCLLWPSENHADLVTLIEQLLDECPDSTAEMVRGLPADSVSLELLPMLIRRCPLKSSSINDYYISDTLRLRGRDAVPVLFEGMRSNDSEYATKCASVLGQMYFDQPNPPAVPNPDPEIVDALLQMHRDPALRDLALIAMQNKSLLLANPPLREVVLPLMFDGSIPMNSSLLKEMYHKRINHDTVLAHMRDKYRGIDPANLTGADRREYFVYFPHAAAVPDQEQFIADARALWQTAKEDHAKRAAHPDNVNDRPAFDSPSVRLTRIFETLKQVHAPSEDTVRLLLDMTIEWERCQQASARGETCTTFSLSPSFPEQVLATYLKHTPSYWPMVLDALKNERWALVAVFPHDSLGIGLFPDLEGPELPPELMNQFADALLSSAPSYEEPGSKSHLRYEFESDLILYVAAINCIHTDDPRKLARLSEAIEFGPQRVATLALKRVGNIDNRSPEMISVIRKGLSHECSSMRIAAIQAATMLDTEAAAEFIEPIIEATLAPDVSGIIVISALRLFEKHKIDDPRVHAFIDELYRRNSDLFFHVRVTRVR